jgi:hypothetical protein
MKEFKHTSLHSFRNEPKLTIGKRNKVHSEFQIMIFFVNKIKILALRCYITLLTIQAPK